MKNNVLQHAEGVGEGGVRKVYVAHNKSTAAPFMNVLCYRVVLFVCVYIYGVRERERERRGRTGSDGGGGRAI